MSGIKRFTVFRRTAGAITTHNADQKNPDCEAQFEGVMFSDGTVCLRWLTAKRSHSIWASVEDMLAVHGHPEYGTEIEWHDGDEPEAWTRMRGTAGASRADTAEPPDMQLRVAELECEILRRDRWRMDFLTDRPFTVHRTGSGFVFLQVDDRFAGGSDLRDAVDCAMERWGDGTCE